MTADFGDKCSVGNFKNGWQSRRLRPQPLRTIPFVRFLAYYLVHLLVSLSTSEAFVHSPLSKFLWSRQVSWSGRSRQSRTFPQHLSKNKYSGLCSGGTSDDGSGFSWNAIGDNQREDPAPPLSVTTFNVLAPIFKRVGPSRESNFRDSYLERNLRILRHLNDMRLKEGELSYCRCRMHARFDVHVTNHVHEISADLNSDIICLQELWVAKPEIVDMYRRCLEGYRMYTLPRTGSRGDGLACFVKHGIDVLDRQDIRLKGMGGRVALVLHLGIPASGDRPRRELVVANTHLLFPHERTFSILRIREVKKLLAFMECYTQAHDLTRFPVVLCGDFNGIPSGRVHKHLIERGFRCSYEDALGPGADRSRWITHANHRGEEVGVDYVWYRNPNPRLGPMEPDWESIVYQSTKQRLLKTFPDSDYPVSDSEEMEMWSPGGDKMMDGLTGGGVEEAGDRTHDEKDKLSAACKLLGLSEGFELDEEELQLLLDSSADDFDFLVPTILDGSSTGLEGAVGGLPSLTTIRESRSRLAGSCTLETKSSQIWPRALERGVWPSDYNVSDHGSLTTCFRVAAPTAEMASSTRDLVFDSPPLELSAASAAGISRNRTESRDFGGIDDGFYGLR